jgi:diguanylate cyclase (GGDEF)-like protein
MKILPESSPARSDFAIELWRMLAPYLAVAQTVLAAAYLLVGGGGARWLPILILFILQGVLNLFLTLQAFRLANITNLMRVFACVNWAISAAVVLLAGGYPTLFWLLFILGAIHSGLFIGAAGILINTFLVGAVLSIPAYARIGFTQETAIDIGLQMVFLLVIGFITERSTSMLLGEREKYMLAEEALRESHAELTVSLERQQHQAQEMTLLSEMGDFLHACPVLEDTYAIIGYYVPRLLPFPDGVLLLGDETKDALKPAAAWGGLEVDKNAPSCTPAHCWALRREQIHSMDESTPGLRCHHLDPAAVSRSMCVPLIAQRDVIGVLNLQRPKNIGAEPAAAESQTRTLALAKSIGEHITLAVANLRLRETLRNQSIRDPLTGLFNRRYLEETLEREIHRAVREQAPLSIIFLDIDHFKSFNDQFGHEAGDAVLRQLGAFLTAQVRYEDIACRYGGEEFVIVLPDASLGVAAQRAEGIRAGIKNMTVVVGGRSLQGITLSLGVSAVPEFDSTGEALLRAADAALYQAKAEGRDRVTVAKTAE